MECCPLPTLDTLLCLLLFKLNLPSFTGRGKIRMPPQKVTYMSKKYIIYICCLIVLIRNKGVGIVELGWVSRLIHNFCFLSLKLFSKSQTHTHTHNHCLVQQLFKNLETFDYYIFLYSNFL